MENLKITLFQGYLFWENIDKNLQNIALQALFISAKNKPDYFTRDVQYRFTMEAETLAEPMGGKP